MLLALNKHYLKLGYYCTGSEEGPSVLVFHNFLAREATNHFEVQLIMNRVTLEQIIFGFSQNFRVLPFQCGNVR